MIRTQYYIIPDRILSSRADSFPFSISWMWLHHTCCAVNYSHSLCLSGPDDLALAVWADELSLQRLPGVWTSLSADWPGQGRTDFLLCYPMSDLWSTVLFFFSPPLLEKHSIGKPSVIPWSLNTNILGAKLWFPGPQQPVTWGGLSHSETLCIHWVSWLTLLLVLGLGFGVAFLHFSQCWNKRVCTAA